MQRGLSPFDAVVVSAVLGDRLAQDCGIVTGSRMVRFAARVRYLKRISWGTVENRPAFVSKKTGLSWADLTPRHWVYPVFEAAFQNAFRARFRNDDERLVSWHGSLSMPTYPVCWQSGEVDTNDPWHHRLQFRTRHTRLLSRASTRPAIVGGQRPRLATPPTAARSRRQNICLEALGKDPSATQHCVTVEPACGNNQSHSLSRDGQICQAAMITTVYPLRSCSAAWTTAAHIRRADSEYYGVASRSCLIDYKASRHECGGAKRMNHDADSFCKTNASRRPEFIKSESEPIFHAETHP